MVCSPFARSFSTTRPDVSVVAESSVPSTVIEAPATGFPVSLFLTTIRTVLDCWAYTPIHRNIRSAKILKLFIDRNTGRRQVEVYRIRLKSCWIMGPEQRPEQALN